MLIDFTPTTTIEYVIIVNIVITCILLVLLLLCTAIIGDGDVEEKSLILEARVVVEECPCLRCDVHT